MSRWQKFRLSLPVKWLLGAGIVVRWTVRLLLLFLVVDLFYLAVNWPDWNKLVSGPVPKTAFMLDYEQAHAKNGHAGKFNWRPVPLSVVPKHLQRAVIVAEDSRFYEHSGFDLVAFKEAMDYNMAEGRLARGASTISQQTVKNLFLTASRSPLRKWHELILTWGMERHLSKRRIMELYLNVAEFGPGIYGVQAAAQAYWGVNIGDIGPRQSAELASTLPSPVRNNPATRTQRFQNRATKIFNLLLRYPGDAAGALSGYLPVEPSAHEGSTGASGEESSEPESEEPEETESETPADQGAAASTEPPA
jgi:monofunctional biosynthetic peptidoglycan transglycosylase